jgi:hypothetical protein
VPGTQVVGHRLRKRIGEPEHPTRPGCYGTIQRLGVSEGDVRRSASPRHLHRALERIFETPEKRPAVPVDDWLSGHHSGVIFRSSSDSPLPTIHLHRRGGSRPPAARYSPNKWPSLAALVSRYLWFSSPGRTVCGIRSIIRILCASSPAILRGLLVRMRMAVIP